MVDAELSVDAAARLWGIDRGQVQKLLRSDSVRRPTQVVDWLRSRRNYQQDPEGSLAPRKPAGA